jgi:carbon-monoxide dehydrogenase large subunit
MKMTLKRTRPDGSPMFAPAHHGLAVDRARHVGDPVALVVAETRAQAEDAADLVRVDYEPLPSVTDTGSAAQPGSAPVWDECPDNVCIRPETRRPPTRPSRRPRTWCGAAT